MFNSSIRKITIISQSTILKKKCNNQSTNQLKKSIEENQTEKQRPLFRTQYTNSHASQKLLIKTKLQKTRTILILIIFHGKTASLKGKKPKLVWNNKLKIKTMNFLQV
jgi:hypothetical protein